MVEQHPGRGRGGRGRARGIGLAVAYYAIAGLVGLAAGGLLLISTVTAIAGGCYVVFHLRDSGPLLEIGSLPAAFCEQRTDLLGLIVPSIVAGVLLPTAWRLRRDPPKLGWWVGAGLVGGIGVALVPVIVIAWAVSFYGPEMIGATYVVVGVLPLVWALASAAIVWRMATRRDDRRAQLAAVGGGLLLAVMAPVLSAGNAPPGASDPSMTDSLGSVTLQLQRPIEFADSGQASCQVAEDGDEFSVFFDGDRLPVEGRPFVRATLSLGDRFGTGEGGRDNGLELWIDVEYPNTGRGVELWSTDDSVLEGDVGAAAGTLRFAALVPRPYGGGPPEPLELEFEGTMEWTCSG